ncbi:hypothetical protein RhiLY_10052 [Ceratobasidium sp. AG-Ba]|nr:hypothetical protein RhiLY_10052 [Ceratobasidium sp. AG-Ba]
MPTRFPGPSGTFEGHLDFDLAVLGFFEREQITRIGHYPSLQAQAYGRMADFPFSVWRSRLFARSITSRMWNSSSTPLCHSKSPKHCNHSDLTLAEIKLLLSFFVLAGRIMVSCGFEGLAESITNYDEVSASPLNHLRYAGVRARIVDPYRGFGIPDQPL